MTQEMYPLTSSDRERQRLRTQAEALRPMTLRMLDGAAIGPGARVLELGCGTGEVTALIAERVGPSGEIVAIDRDPAQIEAARARLAGQRNIQWIVSEIDDFQPTAAFDAVVGRYVLIYLRDPEQTVAHAARWLRPGGRLAFLEMDFHRGAASIIWPAPSAATARAIAFIADVMLDAGVQPHMAARLPSMLSGLGAVQAEVGAPIQLGARSVELPLEAVRSVQPTARRLHRPDADDHDVDALLQAELAGRDARTVTVPPLSVAAWVAVT